MKSIITLLIAFLLFAPSQSQNTFNYSVELQAINVPNLPGLHSYAFGQHNGKWLIIGGRLDGLHARQPFNAFPASQNNDELMVIDIASQEFWTAPLTDLPTGLQEQLQSTNMNFYQDGDTLFIVGGYAYASSVDDHITFPNLTSIDVPGTIDAIINNQSLAPYFKQLSDAIFAVTGAQMGKIGDYFYLIGGHRFDGRYNPMNNPTFVQEYTDEIRKFTIDNSGSQLSYDNYTTLSDPVHLHRRDYNLLPQIFPGGEFGYTLSSGVFQINQDLPYLYPIDITETSIFPMTEFNQYLSNYHSASTYLYDSTNEEMHSIFFGGMAQYYYSNGTLIQDNNVPFVKTISLLTRHQDGNLEEFVLPIEMPLFTGASAEFIPNQSLPHLDDNIIDLASIPQTDFVIGHIYGGIESPLLNPFTANQTSQTDAGSVIYEVSLHFNPLDLVTVDGGNPYAVEIYPNPTQGTFYVQLNKQPERSLYYFLTDTKGAIVQEGYLDINENRFAFNVPKTLADQVLFLTMNIDDTYYLDQQIIVDK